MNYSQSKNKFRQLINERRELCEKAKSLFHRAEKGGEVWFKAGKLYRRSLITLREMEREQEKYK